MKNIVSELIRIIITTFAGLLAIFAFFAALGGILFIADQTNTAVGFILLLLVLAYWVGGYII